MRMNKRWEVRPEPGKEILKSFGDIPKPIARALFHRGIYDAESACVFINPAADIPPDPYLMADMETAVDRIRQAIRSGDPIVIYGDYDADGVTATAMLVDYFSSLGAKASAYIPSRFEEGYGLNCAAIQSLAGQGAKVIVSVDCGARSVEEAELSRSLGVDLIITDHHAPGDVHPPALAFLDPKRVDCRYPDKNLAGVGVAYRFLQAIANTLDEGGGSQPEEYLDLVAIGTVADMAPLLGENRSLVRAGLNRLNQPASGSLRTGVEQLLQVAGVSRGKINATAIGFLIGPRLNAAGRIDTANTALRLLLTRDSREAQEYASLLDARNRERQTLTRATFAEARRIMLERQASASGEIPYFIMIEQAEFNAGVIGLAASKMMEEFYRPSAVVTMDGEYARGSIRSIPGFHITEALESCHQLLDRYGGHAAAAGFTVRVDRLPELYRQLEQRARESLGGQALQPVLTIDSEVTLPELTWDFLGWLNKMEPFGQGNPAPIFSASGVQVVSRRTVGKESAHLKLTLTDSKTRFDAIGFGFGARADTLPPVINVAFSLEENDYYGKQLQMRIIDIQDPSTA